MERALLNKVIAIQNMLIAHATGERCDDSIYRRFRRELLWERDPRVSRYLPQIVQDCHDLPQFWDLIKRMYPSYQERRDYLRAEFKRLLDSLEVEKAAPSDQAITEVLQYIDWDYVQDAWKKALARRDTDAEGAITAARSLLEAVCKHILDKSGVPYDDRMELPKLYSKAAEQMNLAPSQHTEQIIKQILGGCHAVVEGLGSLRNRLGDAHGKGSSHVRVSPRHAEFAVNLAGTTATFLIRTWEERIVPAMNKDRADTLPSIMVR